jgi:hypothetical protein
VRIFAQVADRLCGATGMAVSRSLGGTAGFPNDVASSPRRYPACPVVQDRSQPEGTNYHGRCSVDREAGAPHRYVQARCFAETDSTDLVDRVELTDRAVMAIE